MRQTQLWPAASILVLGGWLSLTGACFGGENEDRGQSNRPANSASEPSAGQNQQRVQGTREQSPQSDSDDHVHHHAALGVLTGNSDSGVSIVGIIPGSPAALAGLHVGDVVRHVGDQRIHTTQELTEKVRKYEPGSPIDLTIRRDGDRRIVKVTFGSQEATFGNRYQANRMTTAGNEGSSVNKPRRSSGAADSGNQQIRALQRQIARLQQEVDRLMSYQNAQQSEQQDMESEDWGWDGRDDQGHDPALFQ